LDVAKCCTVNPCSVRLKRLATMLRSCPRARLGKTKQWLPRQPLGQAASICRQRMKK
jgi:hypothetical protein